MWWTKKGSGLAHFTFCWHLKKAYKKYMYYWFHLHFKYFIDKSIGLDNRLCLYKSSPTTRWNHLNTIYILILRNWRQGMLILIACASLTLTNLNPVFFVGSLFIIFLFFCVFFWFLSSSCVCFLCLWIVHYWLLFRFALTFIEFKTLGACSPLWFSKIVDI